jgi:hypothetical protein
LRSCLTKVLLINWWDRCLVMMGFNGMQPFWLYFLQDAVKFEFDSSFSREQYFVLLVLKWPSFSNFFRVTKPEEMMAKLTVIILISSSLSGYLAGYYSDKVLFWNNDEKTFQSLSYSDREFCISFVLL